MDKIREMLKNMSARTKRLLAIIIGVTAAAIVAGVVLLNVTGKTEYTALFTGLSSDEAQQVGELLKDKSVDYKYVASSGTIRVPEDQADTLRVELLAQGYPKSGFAYDIYMNHSGVMTTESDKKQYTLYDLQDRLGATIRLFDGVQDAKVTIAEGSDSTYALDDNSKVDASASAVVTMEDGKTLSEESADAIRNLIARSVQGMNFTNVSVFDASTMTEVGGSEDTETSSASAVNDLEAKLAGSIEGKVRKVLGKIYGPENVAVSVRGILDPSHSVSEATTYNVPEKTDDQDKTGLVKSETTSSENAGTSSGSGGNVAGTDANADTPDYTTDSGSNASESSSSTSASRDYLYNETTQQTETDPGRLTDLTVAVVITTNDTSSVNDSDLTNLVADAAGIARTDASSKITIVRSAPQESADASSTSENTTAQTFPPLFMLIAAGAAVLLILLILLFVITGKKRRKREQLEEEAEAAEEERNRAAAAAAAAAKQKKPRELSEEEKQGNIHVQRSMKLKDSIGSFIDENPQVAAKLVEGWLNEEDPNEKKQFR